MSSLDFTAFLKLVAHKKASDLFITAGVPPSMKLHGKVVLLTQEPLEPKKTHYAEVIAISALSLLRLLNDILDASKLEQATVQFEQIDFSLYAVCDHCVETMGVLAQRKGAAHQGGGRDGEGDERVHHPGVWFRGCTCT